MNTKRIAIVMPVMLLALSSVHAAAGRTAGTFNVSSTGAATYNIPIWVPPGPRGIQPSLSINYNSQAGDGTMGPGWFLAGLSSISRCNKTFAQDGAPAAISLTMGDGYCLDGNRLRPTSGPGTYGQEGSTYQTEIANFSKIILHTTATDGVAVQNGPAWFEVWGKDGLIYQYGNTGDPDKPDNASRIYAYVNGNYTTTPQQWLLNKVIDRSGNKYVVTYGDGAAGTTSVGIGVPISISYTPVSAGATTYKYAVTFVYGNDTEEGTEVGYVNGALIKNTNMLTRITVASGLTVLRQYKLGYQPAPTTVRNRLSSIQECSDGTTNDCLPSTSIAYSDGQVGMGDLQAALATTNRVAPVAVCDLNGDKRDDIVYWDYDAGNNISVLLANSGAPGFSNPISLGVALTTSVSCGDLVGSGQNDLIIPVGAYGSSVLWRYRWDAGSNSIVSSNLGIPSNERAVLADVNGDGFPDIVTHSGPGVYARLNTSSSGSLAFGSNTLMYTGPLSEYYDLKSADMTSGLRFFDFNGDGRQDLIFTESAIDSQASTLYISHYLLISNGSAFSAVGPYTSTTSANLVGVNLNDDSCTDFVWYGETPGSQAYLSACNGSTGAPIALGYPYLGSIDWDADGHSDPLVVDGSNLGVLYSTGDALASLAATSLPAPCTGCLFVLDLDGDGLQDYAAYDSSVGGIRFRLHNGSSTSPDLVTGITDGLGVAVTPTYTTLAQGNYTKAAGLLATCDGSTAVCEKEFDQPLRVVNQVGRSDGVGGTYSTTYAYTGATEHLHRGFAGFQSIKETDNRSNSPVINTYYKTTFPYIGMAYQQDVFQHNGTTLISQAVISPASQTLDDTANNQRYFAHASNVSTQLYEVSGSLTQTKSMGYTYYADGTGNLQSLVETATDNDATSIYSGQSWTKTTTTSILPDTGNNWCLSVPTSVQVVSTSPGSSVTQLTSYTPDTVKCRITAEVIEPNKPTLRVDRGYAFDVFGNVQTTTVAGRTSSGASMTARVSGQGFDSTGRFPTTLTDALSQQTLQTFDSDTGMQTGATDPNGVALVLAYDPFLRKTTETRADGTSTTWDYSDCTVNGSCINGNNRLIVVQTDRNNGGSTQKVTTSYLDTFDRLLVTTAPDVTGKQVRAETQYDVLGRIARQSVPCNAASCSLYWQEFGYDALGRQTSATRPRSASNPALVTTTTAYAGRTITVTDPLLHQSKQMVSVVGTLVKTTDANNYSQTLTYDALGNPLTVTDSTGIQLMSGITYDYGAGAFQRTISDASLGSYSYTYNSLGERTGWTDPKGQVFSMTYDALSRPTQRTDDGGAPDAVTTFVYGANAGDHNIGKLASVSNGIYSESYTYDSLARPISRTINADVTYQYQYAYNSTTGFLDTLRYPTSNGCYNLVVKYSYTNGQVSKVQDYSNATLGTVYWQVDTTAPFGSVFDSLGNDVKIQRDYDVVTGLLTRLQAGKNGGAAIQNQTYLYDDVGNLTQRQNNNRGLSENFVNDAVNRVNSSDVNGVSNLAVNYSDSGNISTKTGTSGTWVYGNASRPHQVTQAGSNTYAYDANGNMTSRNGYAIYWSSYNYPTEIRGADETFLFSYGPDRQRWRQISASAAGTETTYIIGKALEKTILVDGTTDYRHTVYAGGQAVALVSRASTGTNTTRYLIEDHLGSTTTIVNSDANATVAVEESFGAFGVPRDPTNWTGAQSGADQAIIAGITRQGYTGHTMLGNSGLIHMNGRVQDAVTGRFLSPDPYLQDPGNTQHYNRYSYVNNNPLTYTDPSGFLYCTTITYPHWTPAEPYYDWNTEQVVIPAWGVWTEVSVPVCYSSDPNEGGSPGSGGDGSTDEPQPSTPTQQTTQEKWICSKQGKAVISSAVGGAVTAGIYSGGNPLAMVGGAAVGGSIAYAADWLESYHNLSPVVQGVLGAADESPRGGGASALVTGVLTSGGIPSWKAATVGGAVYGAITSGSGATLLPNIAKGGIAGGAGALAAKGVSSVLDWACSP